MTVALAALLTAAAPAATSAEAAQHGCIAPNVVGVDLAMARGALRASGCGVTVDQLPAHGQYVTPSSADARQVVRFQAPKAGSRTGGVTVSLKPLCAQSADPGPDVRGPTSGRGPTELVTGMFLDGGPLVIAPRCRHGVASAAALTVTTVGGQVVAHRSVRAGRFGVFPLKPGSYLLTGILSDAPGGAHAGPQSVTIAPGHTTRLNLVASIP